MVHINRRDMTNSNIKKKYRKSDKFKYKNPVLYTSRGLSHSAFFLPMSFGGHNLTMFWIHSTNIAQTNSDVDANLMQTWCKRRMKLGHVLVEVCPIDFLDVDGLTHADCRSRGEGRGVKLSPVDHWAAESCANG